MSVRDVSVSGARGESYADILRRIGLFGVLPSDSDAQALAKITADAAASAAMAEALVGPNYPDTATGLAAVAEGGSFAVDNGDGTVTIYRKVAGVAVEQRHVLTLAYLASAIGASLVGAGDTTLTALLPNTPNEYGAVGDNVTDDGPAVQAALDAGAHVLFLPADGYAIGTPVVKVVSVDTTLDFNGQTIAGGNMIDLSAPQRAGVRTLAANATHGDKEIMITNAGDIQPGDVVNIQSQISPSFQYADTKMDTVRVESKVGSTLYLHDPLSFDWAAPAAYVAVGGQTDFAFPGALAGFVDVYQNGVLKTEGVHYTVGVDEIVLAAGAAADDQITVQEKGLGVYAFEAVNLTLRRPKIDLNQVDGATVGTWGIRATGFARVIIESPIIGGLLPFTRYHAVAANENIYRYGIQLWYCAEWRLTNGSYSAVSYPVGVYGGSRNGRETNSTARYCRHAHADLGGWSRGYTLDGLDDRDSRAGLSTHPAIDCRAMNVRSLNNLFIPAWRSVGGSLEGKYHTLDASASTPEFDPGQLRPGFEYLYEQADYDYSSLEIESPNRSANSMAQRYGRTVYLGRTFATGISVADDVGNTIVGAGNSFGPTGRPTPRANDILSSATLHVSPVLDAVGYVHVAYDTETVPFVAGGIVTGGTSGATGVIASVQDDGATGVLLLSSVTGTFVDNEGLAGSAGGAALANGAPVLRHHINPREQLAQQGNGRLSCRGVIARNLAGEPANLSVRVHTNAFARLLQSDFLFGRIRLVAWVLHSNAGLFAPKIKDYAFCFGANAGPSLLSFPLTAMFESQATGVANESLTMTLADPVFAGVTEIGNNADHYVQFSVALASGRATPSYSLFYEMELADADFA